jgi:hypothetical protein
VLRVSTTEVKKELGVWITVGEPVGEHESERRLPHAAHTLQGSPCAGNRDASGIGSSEALFERRKVGISADEGGWRSRELVERRAESGRGCVDVNLFPNHNIYVTVRPHVRQGDNPRICGRIGG